MREIILKTDALQRLLISKGWNFTDLSKESSVAKATISRAINNNHSISNRTVHNLCTALNCEFEEIFELRKPEKVN